MRNILLFALLLMQYTQFYAQCPATISSLGNGNGLQICWPNNQAPTTLDSIFYDNVSYAGAFVNAGQGDCWRTTDPATLGTNGNHQIAFSFDGTNVVCEVVSGVVVPVPIHLSVDYAYFLVKNIDGKAQILWETAEEENNDYFQVERSADGLEFEAIGIVQGIGTASKYQFEDTESNYLRGTYYYRLKQVDFDGASAYSAVRSLSLDFSVANEVTIFPNPVSDQLTVVVETEWSEDVSLNVYNLTGQLIFQKNLSFTNYEQTNFIDVSSLDSGLYLIEIKGKQFAKSLSFVKK